MKIAILGAMSEEISPLLQILENKKEISYAGNKFYEGKLEGVEVVVAYSKIGKVNSTVTATLMLEKFGADRLIFTGVAGAISDDLKVGDVMIATRLCQHDVDITAFGHPSGFIPESKLFIDSNKELNSLINRSAKECGISLKEGIIATGDQFVANHERKEWIKEEFKADALEMEGASVANVCDLLNKPFSIIRSISDSADGNANIDFDKFLETSAQNSANIVINFLKHISK